MNLRGLDALVRSGQQATRRPAPRAGRGARRSLTAALCAALGLSALVFLAPTATAASPAASPAATPAADSTSPTDLVIAAVYGGSGGSSTYDWIELYNPTDAAIQLGTVSGTAVTPNYYLCYRAYNGSSCTGTSSMKLWGTVPAHHYFFVATSGTAGPEANGVKPDLDLTAAANNAAGETGPNMGGTTTGGQVLLLNASSNGAATMTGDLSSASAQAAGVVDAVGWTHYASSAYTQPTSAETNGATTILGANGGTSNTNVIARNFTSGVPVDTNTNSTDFTAVAETSYVLHSTVGDQVNIAAVSDTKIAAGAAMSPLQVSASGGVASLTYSASGLPDGVTIDPNTGVISGTPTSPVGDYPVTVTASDWNSNDTWASTSIDSASTTFTLTVANEVLIQKIPAVSAHKGSAMTPVQVQASGGTAPYTYTATGLPAGVSIDPNTGVISGTPTDTVKKYSPQVTVTDSGTGANALSSTASFTFTELPATTGASSGDPLSGLKINEVEATGTPANDWVELYNTGAAITNASVDLVNSSGESYTLPTQDIAAGAYVVVHGSDMDAAGLDLAASDTLYLDETGDNTVLDQTSWTSYTSTSWARFPDGTGPFAVSASATEGTANTLPGAADTDHLVVAAVYGADGSVFNSDWVQLYNPTDAPISLGTLNSDNSVTPNYYQCYRSNSSNTCSSMKLYGTVEPHHYFLIWNGHNSDATVTAHSQGVPPAGITPDLDFRYGSDDTNGAAVEAQNDPSGQTNNGFGGCNTGGQLWLLNAASNGTAAGGDMASAANKAAGVVDGVGWTSSGVTEPTGAESKGSTAVAGFNSGTNNACVIARKWVDGYPVDTDNNSNDFTAIQDPSTYNLQSQASERVTLSPIANTEISINEAMEPISVQAQAVYGALTYSATGLPDGVTIDPTTGIISGTPSATDTLQDYPVTVTVGDAVASDTNTVSFTLTLSKELRLDPIANVSGPEGTAINEIDVVGHGGTPPYTFAATGLPKGLSINATTGAITGTPTDTLGHYDIKVSATDSGVGANQATVSEDFTFAELPSSTSPTSGDPLATLTLNEVKATGTAANDWVELYNNGAAITGAAVTLEDSAGHTYQVPTQNIPAHGYVVIKGSDMDAAGLDLTSNDTLYLAETGNDALLDQTSWSSYAPTSWARTTDGTGAFAVSAYPTPGAANSGAPVIHPNDLLVSEVNYDNNSTDYYEYSEITNTTDHPIDFDAYGLTITKSGAVMTLHSSTDTSGSSPVVDPVIPAHGTQLFWWDENQYLGVKTTAQFLANYGLPASTPVILVQGFSSMANSGGDHSYYISVNQGSNFISQSWVDTPCAANTFNGSATCTATNGNYAEHYAVPADRTNPTSAVWYNSLHSGGDDMDYVLKPALSTPGTIDLEQVGFTRAVKIASVTTDAVTLHNTSDAAVDLSGYVLERNSSGGSYTLPAGTTVGAGDDLVVTSGESNLTFTGRDYASLLAPQGYAYTDGVGIADTTGPFLYTLPYSAGPVQIDPTTGLALPPAGGLYRPAGVSASNGVVYASNTGDNVLATMTDGTNTTIAGSLAGYGDQGDGGPASAAQLYQPGGTAEDAAGDVFIADSGDNVVREITPDGTIHLFAGTGDAGGAAEAVTASSTPTTVNLSHPDGVAVDSAGDVYIADTFDNRILEVTTGGVIKVVAGTGTAGYTGDGAAATSATLSMPAGIAVDAQGDLYIADSSNNVIRRVDAATGDITTVAGDYAADEASNSCLGGFSGDGGPATSAELNDPQGIAVDGAGDLFIADTFNNAIREVTPDGTISTVVNSSAVGSSENTSPTGSGAVPTSTHLNTPYAVAVDASTSTLYIADTKNNAIAQVNNVVFSGTASGPTEPAAQVAVTGSGQAASACAALLNGPVANTSAPSVTGTLVAGSVGSVLTANTGSWNPTPDSFSYQWLRDGTPIAGATRSTYTVTAADRGHLVSVSVTASKTDYASASATSAAVSIPPIGTMTTATPTISGTFKVGAKVTAKPGTWKAGTAAVRSFTYRWLRNGVAIAKATSETYTLTAADQGKRISVTVTGSYTGYTTASRTSAAHAIAAGSLTTATPRIHGTARVGKKLTAVAGTWKAGTVRLTGSHLRYQWYVGGKKIAGATHTTYTVPAKDKGKRITVKVTGSYAGYTTVVKTSKSTAAIKAK